MRVFRVVGIAIGSLLCTTVGGYADEQAPLPGNGQAPPAEASAPAPESGSSSSSSYYFRGHGVKDSNVYAPKYKQRLQNWREQLAMGLEKGFLKPEDGARFNLVLDHLTTLEAEVAGKNYPKPELDAMEQEFNAFNVDFTRAMQPKVEPVVSPAVTAPPVVAPPVVPPAKPPTPAVSKTQPKVVVKKTPVKVKLQSKKKRH